MGGRFKGTERLLPACVLSGCAPRERDPAQFQVISELFLNEEMTLDWKCLVIKEKSLCL